MKVYKVLELINRRTRLLVSNVKKGCDQRG